MIVTFNGAKSAAEEMLGGGPQGTVLGMFLFLILINKAGFEEQNLKLGEKLTTAAGRRDEISKMHAKYVDDMTAAQTVQMKTDLEKDENRFWPKPAMKRERFEQTLPAEKNEIQDQLDELCAYAETNQMKLNCEKTKVMLFNAAKHNDFMPEIKVKDENQNIEVVEEFKLLGIMITSDLKWDANTNSITKKAYQRLWMVRRLMNLGLKRRNLVKVYTTQIRSLLEFGAVTWHSMLTKENEKCIERVQKAAVSIILGPDYHDYQSGLMQLGLERLDLRRVKLSLNFAKKATKHVKHSNWFVENIASKQVNTRSVKQTYKPVQARTQRLMKSPISFLTNQLNALNEIVP